MENYSSSRCRHVIERPKEGHGCHSNTVYLRMGVQVGTSTHTQLPARDEKGKGFAQYVYPTVCTLDLELNEQGTDCCVT